LLALIFFLLEIAISSQMARHPRLPKAASASVSARHASTPLPMLRRRKEPWSTGHCRRKTC
jgi:hypothetical protein